MVDFRWRRGAPEYWLQIETRATASLAQLDGLLRSTWLECCGHLSAFYVGRAEVSKRTRIGDLPTQGRAFDYEYDFGSTTYLTSRVVGGRVGSLGRRAVRLLARNAPIPQACSECETPATFIVRYVSLRRPASSVRSMAGHIRARGTSNFRPSSTPPGPGCAATPAETVA